ncbi:MAG TPA: diaminopimelate epimerase [Candidatus Methanomethylophilaceae archaeon]|nr:diaminopimelate epimerase [Candidatus Methanomethylophilaceae archaeon]
MIFWKYHGLGNDFIIVDGMDGTVEVDKEWCKNVCRRNFDVGADGVLYIMPGEDTDITMVVINADGTEAEMCGNGIRCVAKHAYDHNLVTEQRFSINTLAGEKDATVTLGKDGKVSTVSIDMGAPILNGKSIPIDHDGRFIDEPFVIGSLRIRGTAVSMGNPHFITFTELPDETINRLGPELEKHEFFLNKTNVEFCQMKEGKIYVRAYERGAGWTLACGTGASASTVAAALIGLVPFDEPIDVHLPGGWLKVTVARDLGYVIMEGPAEFVFKGEI